MRAEIRKIQQMMESGRLRHRSRHRDVGLPGDDPQEAAADRGAGRRRQDRDRQGAGRGARHRPDPAAVLRGAGRGPALYEWNYPKQMLHIRLEEGAPSARSRREGGDDLHRAVPAQAAAAAGDHARRRAAGAADRRGRSRRRGVRGVPARGALRLPGDDPRARHHQGDASAVRGPDLEPHARAVRRAPAPLPVPLDRLSRASTRKSRSCTRKVPGVNERAGRADRRASCRRCAACAWPRCRAWPRRSTGRGA